MSRPTMSVLPPGGNGTISLTGLAGYGCAMALPAATRSTNATPSNLFMRSSSGSQPEPLDLSGRGLRQLAHELDPAGVLVRGEPAFHVLLKGLFQVLISRDPLLEDHVRLRLDE